jgi:lycopene cyclase domain-containing protein
MSTYLFINLAILIVPLAFSFERRIFFFRKWPAVFCSIFFVGIFYVVWDISACRRGDWGFNPQHVSDLTLLNLPFEEILFFVTAPFSCLFIYEVINFFHPDKHVPVKKSLVNAVLLVSLALAFVYSLRHYTALSFFSLSVFLFIARKHFFVVLQSENFWIYMVICYAPFAIFNGILTSLPVVQYNPLAIIGWRIGTIPVEDFIYNFSYLGFIALAYKFFDSRISKR